jgi:uncharacterized protein YggT (Ycf19 family)
MTDVKVAEAEARQAAHHAGVKSRFEDRVNAEISGQASSASTGEQAKVAEVAAHMRGSALADTMKGERIVGQARSAARWSQFVDYGFYVVYSLLGIRLLLALIGASSASGFVQFVRGVTDPFYAPFRGIVPSPTADGGYVLVVPIIIALLFYLLLHMGINGVLRMVGHRKTSI